MAYRQPSVENPDFIALVTVFSGAATALAGMSIAQATYLAGGGNYGVATIVDDTVGPLALFGMYFLLGCYLGASMCWLSAEREVDIVPVRMALGAVMGGLLGLGVLLLIGTAVPMGRPIAISGTLLAAFYGARLTTVLRRAKPADRQLRRARVALTAFALLVASVLISYHPNSFPGAEATLDARDAWARKTFGDHYAQSLEYVKGCDDVTRLVGPIRAIGLAAGTNVLFYGTDAATGDFTLEVVGTRGTTLVHIEVSRPIDKKAGDGPGAPPRGANQASGQWAAAGELLDGGRAVPLGCL